MPRSTANRVAKSQAPQTHIRRTPRVSRAPQEGSQVHPLSHLQQAVGNRAVGRLIQAQLTVSRRDADQVADTAMRMLEPVAPDAEQEEEMLQTKPLMRKATDGSGYAASSRLASQLDRAKGSGHALPGPTLASMNRSFGADFSSVRIHTGSEATEMSRGIQANAFTHGRDIYFNAGKYNPATPEGTRLLAHELTHTIQQSANGTGIAAKQQGPLDMAQPVSGTAEVIQRDIGVEFQARNVISQKKGKKRFERVQTKNKPLRKTGGLTLEVDTGSVMEFGTGHYTLWSDLKKDLDAVSAIITEIKGLPKEPLDPAKAEDPDDNPRVFRGFKTDYGKVDITAKPGDFHGKPQSNEDIVLSEFGSMLKENRPNDFQTVETATQSVLGKATTPDLTNFMHILIYHLSLLQRDTPDLVITSGKVKQPKAFLTLMNKTDYTAMFQALSASEQTEFKKLVKADPNPIASAAGVSMTDDLFKVGYWGWHPDRPKNRVLIQQGKIVRIQKKIPGVVGEGTDGDIHTCGDKGVPPRYCKTKKRIEQVTVGAWLRSMITPSKRTKKSITAPLPTYSGLKSGGFSWGLSKARPGTFLFEMRGYKGMPIADWPDFAEKKFNFAANCRPGSKLTYDGKKPKPAC